MSSTAQFVRHELCNDKVQPVDDLRVDEIVSTAQDLLFILCWLDLRMVFLKQKYPGLLVATMVEVEPLPENKNSIGCNWIFKVKRHADDSLARCKCRLVV